jgi:type III secretion YscU/HrpY family protein
MSGEKTEQPTPKRLKDARKKGQVAKSQDLTEAVLFLTAVGVLAAGGSAFVSELRAIMTGLFQPRILAGDLPDDELLRRTGQAWGRALLLLSPLLGAVFVAAAAINFLQVQALFSMEVIKPKLEKLNPLQGFQNLFFKAKTYLELLKMLIKFAVVFALAYAVLIGSLKDVILTARQDPATAGRLASILMFSILFKAGLIFFVLGAADFLLQKRMHLKSLRMSKYEVQKEYKEDDGDPHIKHLRKHLHEELLANDVTKKVPKAAVVVVNPTHIAVAIEYDESAMNAPIVSAKGKMVIAERIIALAREHHIPIVRQIALARSLYKVEVDSEIPEDLYGAVAEVLNWVYTLSQEERGENML